MLETFRTAEKPGEAAHWSRLERALAPLEGFAGEWAVCGGWAIDLFMDRPGRDHSDVDVMLFREDQHLLRLHFTDFDLRRVRKRDGAREVVTWNRGETIELPEHEIHAEGRGVRLEFLLNDRRAPDPGAGWGPVSLLPETGDPGGWVYRRDPRVVHELETLILRTRRGVPVLCPEVVLLYKSEKTRAEDEADFTFALRKLRGRM